MADKKHVKSKHHSPQMPAGAHGHITSTHNGTFHGVAYGGGTVYLPAAQVEPAEDEAPGSEEGGSEGSEGSMGASLEISEAIADIMSRRRGKLRA